LKLSTYVLGRYMSLSRHTYRRALQPSSLALVDYVWISEDILAAAFRQFTNCQHRRQSRVPGPLESRRRLAKRRNTALSCADASGPILDVASHFGKDGSEHMKWKDPLWPWSKPLGKRFTAYACFSAEDLLNYFKG
jgi:hypothetical protein